MKVIKKLDIVLIVVLMVISFVPYLMLKKNTVVNEDINSNYAIVSVAGKVLKRIELKPDLNDEYIVETSYGSNKVVIRDGSIGIVEADCADGVCVGQGYINKPGQQVVCLPHRLIITIEGKNTEDKSEDIISK